MAESARGRKATRPATRRGAVRLPTPVRRRSRGPGAAPSPQGAPAAGSYSARATAIHRSTVPLAGRSGDRSRSWSERPKPPGPPPPARERGLSPHLASATDLAELEAQADRVARGRPDGVAPLAQRHPELDREPGVGPPSRRLDAGRASNRDRLARVATADDEPVERQQKLLAEALVEALAPGAVRLAVGPGPPSAPLPVAPQPDRERNAVAVARPSARVEPDGQAPSRDAAGLPRVAGHDDEVERVGVVADPQAEAGLLGDRPERALPLAGVAVDGHGVRGRTALDRRQRTGAGGKSHKREREGEDEAHGAARGSGER